MLHRIWDTALARLRDAVNQATFDRWIKTLRPIGLEEDMVTLGASGDFGRQWVTKKYVGKIAAIFSECLSRPVDVKVVVDEAPPPAPQAVAVVSKPARQSRKANYPKPEFTPRFTFSRFVMGPSNRLALAGARAVADAPGKKYNPLFIYGGPGLGKTHLLHAIGQHVYSRDESFHSAYLTGQAFAEDFIHSVRSGRAGDFRQMQRNVDMWLVDDVQFIAGKERTQEEFFHTFNALYESGKQIVIISDRGPRELYLMEERLRSRFECGLVADVSPPDFETRAAILISKAEEDGIELPLDVIYFMADKIQSNIRTLEGSLCRLVAESSVTGESMTVAMAERILAGHFIDVNAQKPSPERLLQSSAAQFGVTVDEIMGKTRKASVSQARQVAMYLCRELWHLPWKQIGAAFDKDHTSALYAHRTIGEKLVRDPAFQAVLDRISRDAQDRR